MSWFLDQNVYSVSTVEPNVFVFDRLRNLKMKRNSVAAQFMSQTSFVGRLDQARPEVPMDFNRATDETAGKIFEFHLRALRVLRGYSWIS